MSHDLYMHYCFLGSSDTCPRGHTDLQSPVKCLDHRYCGRDSMQSCKAVVGTTVYLHRLICIQHHRIVVYSLHFAYSCDATQKYGYTHESHE